MYHQSINLLSTLPYRTVLEVVFEEEEEEVER